MNPLLIFKTIGVSVGLGGGITGSIFSSFQAFTRISIEEFLKDDWTTYSGNDDWKLLKEILDNSKNTDKKKLKLTGLEGIKGDKTDTNGGKVRIWCSTKKSLKIKKFLSSNYETILLSYVKDFCIISIGKKLKESNQFTSSTDNLKTLKTKIGILNSHEGNDNTKGDISKEPKLSEIKNMTNNTNNEKEEALLDWCKSTYKKTYKGENDNLWKLANYYCKKSEPTA